ncbi:MAG: ExeA family protein [Gemmatimonadota bacterium]
MYEEFFGLRERPFSLTPNPRYVFYSQRYREAEDQLLYGITQKEGFMLLTGKPGTGKTTLCRDLLEKLDPKTHKSALMFNPFLSGLEMLQGLLTEFGVAFPAKATRKALLDKLNAFLLAQLAANRTCVAIFDEAQHLSSEFLEQIRVLSNLETEQEKLIQIILVGQPELLQKIQTPSMAQLDQRVSVRCIMADLTAEETERYIYHRLNVAGAQGRIEFTPRALRRIYQAAQGVPRVINLVCDRALLAGYVAQSRRIDPAHVEQATAAIQGEDVQTSASPAARIAFKRSHWLVAAAIVGLIVLAAVVGTVAR